MDFINDFLRSQPKGGIPNYNLMGTIAIVVMMVVVLFYLVRMKPNWITFIKGVVIAAITFCFAPYAQYFVVWYRVGFDPARYTAQAANLALGFTLLPLVAWLCAKTFNTSVGFSGDIVALTMLGYHVIGRSGCIFGGCCYGFPCDWGWYSTDTGANQFPVSFVESLFTLAILIFIIVRICHKGYVPDGKNLAYFLLLYGACRFFTEMTRESTKDQWLFWRISDIHIHMLIMALVGGWLLYAIIRKEKAAVADAAEPILPELKGQRH